MSLEVRIVSYHSGEGGAGAGIGGEKIVKATFRGELLPNDSFETHWRVSV